MKVWLHRRRAVLIAVMANLFVLVNAFALEGGPDKFGYRFFDSNAPDAPEFSWIETSLTGNELDLENDQISGGVPIGFNFKFYGETYSHIYASSNGFISFKDDGFATGCCNGDPLPTRRGYWTNLIAGIWDDLNPGG